MGRLQLCSEMLDSFEKKNVKGTNALAYFATTKKELSDMPAGWISFQFISNIKDATTAKPIRVYFILAKKRP
jgi:hypothetical protein